MSTGPFINAFYESDIGEVHNIRIQPETAALVIDGTTNTIPAGPADNAQPIKVSDGQRALGVIPRKVRVRFLTATTSGGVIAAGSIGEFVWLDPGTFLTVTRPGRKEGTYQGASVRVLGGTPERYNG